MKGEVLVYDDNSGEGLISGADGLRYSFRRSDLRQLVPLRKGARVDFDPDGREAKDIFVDSAPSGVASVQPYYGHVEPDLGLWGYFTRCVSVYYANFYGRARRKEYWGFYLFVTIFYVLAVIVVAVAAGMSADQGRSSGNYAPGLWGILAIPLVISVLALILPSISVTVRRFHDIGQSGWIVLLLYILGAVPYVGFVSGIIMLVIACLDSQPGENKYGPPPK